MYIYYISGRPAVPVCAERVVAQSAQRFFAAEVGGKSCNVGIAMS